MKSELKAQFATADQQLDARGLDCPQPGIECRRVLQQMQPDECLHIIASDPNTVLDMEVFCMRTGHQLLASHINTVTDIHLLVKKRPAQARP